MKLIQAIRNSIGLKVSLGLAAASIFLTAIAAYAIIRRETDALEQQIIEKAQFAARQGARHYQELFEDAIKNGILTTQDVFDTNYEEIKAYPFGKTQRFHTKYDFYTDATAMEMQDLMADTPDVLFAVPTDVNGYCPTHNAKQMQAYGDDAEKNFNGNRSKRFFTDETSLKSAKATEDVVMKYYRDTGALAYNVSSPVFVQGRHWGTFRLGVSIDKLQAARTSLLVTLAAMFGALVLATAGLIFLLVRRSMKPLVQLAHQADELSLGEGLDDVIKPATTDEVGKMAKAVDRLRASLRAAMSRLGE